MTTTIEPPLSNEDWTVARMQLKRIMPWLYPIAALVRPTYDPKMQPMSIGGPPPPDAIAAGISADGRLLYGHLPEIHLVWVLAHECCHIFLDCWRRAKDKNLRKFNVAQDLVINQMLAKVANMPKAPNGALFPTPFQLPPDLTTEEYYALLPEPPEDGQGDIEGDDTTQRAARFRDAVRQACRKAGSVPGDFQRVVDEILQESKVKWEVLLRQSVLQGIKRVEGCTVRDYNRPHRLQAALGQDIILGRTQGIMPRILVAVDTSGSMYDLLEQIVGETEAIGHAAGCPVDVCVFDCKVQARCTSKTIRNHMKGWGGTDFHPPLAEAEGYAVCVMVTDGEGPAPSAPPKGTNVVWALVPGGRNPTSYGKVVQCGKTDP